MNPSVYMYRLNGKKGAKIRLLCMKLKIRAVSVRPEQYLLPLGVLTGLTQGSGQNWAGGELPGEMLLFVNFDQRLLDAFLQGFRRDGIPSVALKAVLTPTNLNWTSLQLFEELCREHAVMAAKQRQSFETIIRGGTVIDGSGKSAVRADVGIRDGKIAAIGNLSDATAPHIIDATGKCVTPGFVDIHRHADAAVFRPGFGELELMQGLTTIVNGNCGLSIAPMAGEHEMEIRHYLQPVTGQIDFNVPTDSLADYLNAASHQPLPISVGMLAGSGTIRASCVGYDITRLDEGHFSAIHSRLEQALADGALGVSLGLGYAPECFYTTEELIRALAPLAGSGIPVTVHMREEGDAVVDAVEEMRTVARALKTPVHISHLKAMGSRNWNSKIPMALQTLRQAREEGLDMSCDVYPYTAGSTQLMHILPPDFLTGGTQAVIARLRDPEQRRLLTQRIQTGRDFDNIAQLVGWDNIIMSTLNQPQNKPYEGMTVAAAAKCKGMDPFDCCYDMLISERCAITMIDFITSESDIATILRDPCANVISDSTYPTSGMPHPRLYGTFVRVIEKYVLLDKILPLETAIAKMTRIPADVLGLKQKGRLAVGADADINIFVPEQLHEQGTYADPAHCATGFDLILVGGKIALENGRPTGRNNGKILRR